MELTVFDNHPGVSHIKLAGRLDPGATEQIRDRFRGETVARNRPAVLDVTAVRFMTSVGIGMIVDCANRLTREGYPFVIVANSGRVDDVLRKTGVYAIAGTASSVEDALSKIPTTR